MNDLEHRIVDAYIKNLTEVSKEDRSSSKKMEYSKAQPTIKINETIMLILQCPTESLSTDTLTIIDLVHGSFVLARIFRPNMVFLVLYTAVVIVTSVT